MHVWQEYHRNDVVAFSERNIMGFMMSVCLITDDAALNCLVQVVYAAFLQCKIVIVSLELTDILRRYFEITQILSPQTFTC